MKKKLHSFHTLFFNQNSRAQREMQEVVGYLSQCRIWLWREDKEENKFT